jgi:hypothetical protein
MSHAVLEYIVQFLPKVVYKLFGKVEYPLDYHSINNVSFKFLIEIMSLRNY